MKKNTIVVWYDWGPETWFGKLLKYNSEIDETVRQKLFPWNTDLKLLSHQWSSLATGCIAGVWA